MKELSLKQRIAMKLNEDHLTGKDDMIKFILANCKDYKKSELEDMEDKEIKKIYLDCEKECKGSKGEKCNEKVEHREKKSLVGKIVKITSDNDNYDKFKNKSLVITSATIGGRGYDDAVYPDALCDLEVVKTGEAVPFSLYEYEFEIVGGKGINESHLKTRAEQEKFIIDNDDNYNRKKLKDLTDKEVEKIYIKIEKECSVMEGKKSKLFNRFGTIKKILDKSDKYDREDLMKKSNDDIESIYKSLNEGKKEPNRFEMISNIIKKCGSKYDRKDLMKKSNDEIEEIYDKINEGKKEDDEDGVNNMESPEYFVESYINGQKTQCVKIIYTLLESNEHDVEDLVEYLNSEEPKDMDEMKDFIIKTLVKKINK